MPNLHLEIWVAEFNAHLFARVTSRKNVAANALSYISKHLILIALLLENPPKSNGQLTSTA